MTPIPIPNYPNPQFYTPASTHGVDQAYRLPLPVGTLLDLKRWMVWYGIRATLHAVPVVALIIGPQGQERSVERLVTAQEAEIEAAWAKFFGSQAPFVFKPPTASLMAFLDLVRVFFAVPEWDVPTTMDIAKGLLAVLCTEPDVKLGARLYYFATGSLSVSPDVPQADVLRQFAAEGRLLPCFGRAGNYDYIRDAG